MPNEKRSSRTSVTRTSGDRRLRQISALALGAEDVGGFVSVCGRCVGIFCRSCFPSRSGTGWECTRCKETGRVLLGRRRVVIRSNIGWRRCGFDDSESNAVNWGSERRSGKKKQAVAETKNPSTSGKTAVQFFADFRNICLNPSV